VIADGVVKIPKRQLPVEHPPAAVENDALIEREKSAAAEMEIDGHSQREERREDQPISHSRRSSPV
jgi:hypothetical protein